MNKVSIIDENKTSHFEFSKSQKLEAQRNMLMFENPLDKSIIDSGIIGGAEFEFYINAFDLEHFDEELTTLLDDLSRITDQDILCNPFKDFTRSKEYDKLIIKPDSSLRSYTYGLEITTPIVPIVHLPYYLGHILSIIQKRGYITDTSTGLHLHLSCPEKESKDFDFLGLMLLLNAKKLYDSWPPRPDYSRNVMNVLNCLDFESASGKKDEVGRGWCIIRPDYEDKKNHIEIRTMGGENYQSKYSEQIFPELRTILQSYIDILNHDADDQCDRLKAMQKQKVKTHSDEDQAKMYDTLTIIGVTQG
ncbi:hypothetical protein [Sulfuricurvum sp.]|uniref:hypothetical protein n=1 Tax=Sulfuricurvum sp. TaxID=2025608 RepID=UPI002622E1DC|nr:hypothetical protein [Sulfuricurvum sp.]MDD4950675.1 hypothetical protein [Sulfuricurvum sp.]